MAISAKIINLLQSITVEPILLMHAASASGTEVIKQSLETDKSCFVTLNYTEDICQDLLNHPDESIEVQKAASTLNGLEVAVKEFLSIILLAYIGPLSDRWGRRPFIYLALIGGSLEAISYLLNSIFFTWNAYFILIGPLLLSMSGGTASFQMLMFVSMADITDVNNRTFRIGILKICMSYGRPFGRFIMGQILAVSGYVAVFSTSLLLYALSLIYTYVSLKECLPESNRMSVSGNGLKDIYILPYNAGKSVLKPRSNHKRLIIILTITCIMLALFCSQAPLYLFFHYIFGWDATVFSNWMFYSEMVASTAQLLTVSFLIKILKWSDSTMGITANASEAFMYILLAQMLIPQMSKGNMQVSYKAIYTAAPILGMLRDNVYISIRAIMSKCADTPAELGSLFAAQGMLESVAVMSSGPIYASIYNATIDYFPGAIMMFTATLMFSSMCLFYFQNKLIMKGKEKIGDSRINSQHSK